MTEESFRILIVDDEPDILEFLSYNLQKEGYQVKDAENGKIAIQQVVKFKPHLILLDVMMPYMDGVETCEEIRKLKGMENTIIAFLTARGEDYSQVAGFDAGADDYITKPIRIKILLKRIKALLKRYEQPGKIPKTMEPKSIETNELMIDKERYVVIFKGKEFALPKKEFQLIDLLSSKPDKVFTREEIYDIVWGSNVIVGDRTIDVHIRKLREKFGDKYIKTIKGIGYKFHN